MIHIRTNSEVECLRECGKINARVHEVLRRGLQPGITTRELDNLAFKVMRDAGAKSSITESEGFPGTICVSINDEVGHGVPGNRAVRLGDIVKLDVSVEYHGYHTDCATSHIVGDVADDVIALVRGTAAALQAGVAAAKLDQRCSDISYAIAQTCSNYGLSIVRHAFGHGIGANLHEDPMIANFGPPRQGPKLRPGMVIAIEPVTALGTALTRRKKDGWTDVTIDGSMGAHFEHTVLITESEPEILTEVDQTQSTHGGHRKMKLHSTVVYRDIADGERHMLFQLAAREMDPILMEAWGRRARQDEIFEDGANVVVLNLSSGEVAGFFVYSEHEENVHLNALVIDSTFQGMGLGTGVMDYLEHIGRKRRAYAITLCVQTNNDRAIRLYQKRRFHSLGLCEVNTLLMRKRL